MLCQEILESLVLLSKALVRLACRPKPASIRLLSSIPLPILAASTGTDIGYILSPLFNA